MHIKEGKNKGVKNSYRKIPRKTNRFLSMDKQNGITVQWNTIQQYDMIHVVKGN